MGISKMRWTRSLESRWVKKTAQTTPKNLPPTQFNNKEKVDLKSRFAARKVATTLCSQRFFCLGTKD